MASMHRLLFLAATLAVSAAASVSPTTSGLPHQQQELYRTTSSSCSTKGLGFDDIVSSCNGTQEALLQARGKCCNELGKCGKFICPTMRKIADSVSFLHGLCNNYDACSADGEIAYDATRASDCNLAEGCKAAVEALRQNHAECFCNLAHLRENSGGSSGVREFADLIKQLFPRGH